MLEALAADGHQFAVGMQARTTDPHSKEDVYFGFGAPDGPAPAPKKSIHCPKKILPKLLRLLRPDHPAVKAIETITSAATQQDQLQAVLVQDAAAAAASESSASSDDDDEDDEDASEDDDDLRTLAKGARLVRHALGALRRKRGRDASDARAEVERLRAANQRLRTHVEQLEPTTRELAAARGEIQQLRAVSQRQSARLDRAGALVQALVRRMAGSDGRLTPKAAAELVVIAADAGAIVVSGPEIEMLDAARRFAKEEDRMMWADTERQVLQHLLGHVGRTASGMEAVLADVFPSS